MVWLLSTLAVSSLVPKWEPTYMLNRSTIVMACNETGYFDADAVAKLSKFGVVDIDWSNAKELWSKTSPMDCEERLVKQAEVIKAASPTTKVFVYRNIVKALPWFTDVREKITDPAYEGWFLKFKDKGPYHVNPCANDKCSNLYHDYLQTREGDCGEGLPCGEYLFDHRNESLRSWIVDTFIIGSKNGSGVLNPSIDGYYMDDSWWSTPEPVKSWMPKTGYCSSNSIGGPSEEEYTCNEDMGLDQNDTKAITSGWNQTVAESHAALVENNAFAWHMMETVTLPATNSCVSWFQHEAKTLNEIPLLFQYSATPAPSQADWEKIVAAFLVIRGPYAWVGTAWDGCHSTWIYPWTDLFDKDYGVPLHDTYNEVKPGVFQREWSKVTITYNCDGTAPTFDYKL
eukprot:TRINITY_DN19614_c0_g1_i1.p1 TRINITY_DN19614_c0_g1~~TRINITY_DN19614_c0_g1_i1.p1  ORF type:complete len:414 (+),score=69.34 TRINITY_DN19614_c0_g1_i1:47-1243(+)